MEHDDDAMMDQVAMEAMHALESKDKSAFLEALQVLIAHTLSQMQDEPTEKEDEPC